MLWTIIISHRRYIHVYAPYGSLMIGQDKTDGHLKYAAAVAEKDERVIMHKI